MADYRLAHIVYMHYRYHNTYSTYIRCEWVAIAVRTRDHSFSRRHSIPFEIVLFMRSKVDVKRHTYAIHKMILQGMLMVFFFKVHENAQNVTLRH